jgi:hypothetical protein
MPIAIFIEPLVKTHADGNLGLRWHNTTTKRMIGLVADTTAKWLCVLQKNHWTIYVKQMPGVG